MSHLISKCGEKFPRISQHTLEWMEWVTPFALLCHNTQSPLCLFLNKHKPPHKPPKDHCRITHIEGYENEQDIGWNCEVDDMETHKTVSSINPSPFFSTLFNHSSIPFHQTLTSCLLCLTTAIVNDSSVKRKRVKEV